MKLQFWTSKTEKEALNIQRNPVSSNPAYSDFMTMRHSLAPISSLIDASSSTQHQSNYTSMNEIASTMQAPSIPYENPVIYTPTTHRVSKAKKGKRTYACEFPGCGKVCGVTSYLRTFSLGPFLSATCALHRPSVYDCLHRSSPEQNTKGDTKGITTLRLRSHAPDLDVVKRSIDLICWNDTLRDSK